MEVDCGSITGIWDESQWVLKIYQWLKRDMNPNEYLLCITGRGEGGYFLYSLFILGGYYSVISKTNFSFQIFYIFHCSAFDFFIRTLWGMWDSLGINSNVTWILWLEFKKIRVAWLKSLIFELNCESWVKLNNKRWLE